MNDTEFSDLVKILVTDIYITKLAQKRTPMGPTLVFLANGYIELLKNIRITFIVCRDEQSKERKILWPSSKSPNSTYYNKYVTFPSKDFNEKFDKFVLASYRAYLEEKGII